MYCMLDISSGLQEDSSQISNTGEQHQVMHHTHKEWSELYNVITTHHPADFNNVSVYSAKQYSLDWSVWVVVIRCSPR